MNFRTWCREKWYEHKDELLEYHIPLDRTSAEYFQLYKYWLKREYKHQRNRNV